MSERDVLTGAAERSRSMICSAWGSRTMAALMWSFEGRAQFARPDEVPRAGTEWLGPRGRAFMLWGRRAGTTG